MAVRPQDEQASATDCPDPKQELEDDCETREPGEAMGRRTSARSWMPGRGFGGPGFCSKSHAAHQWLNARRSATPFAQSVARSVSPSSSWGRLPCTKKLSGAAKIRTPTLRSFLAMVFAADPEITAGIRSLVSKVATAMPLAGLAGRASTNWRIRAVIA